MRLRLYISSLSRDYSPLSRETQGTSVSTCNSFEGDEAMHSSLLELSLRETQGTSVSTGNSSEGDAMRLRLWRGSYGVLSNTILEGKSREEAINKRTLKED